MDTYHYAVKIPGQFMTAACKLNLIGWSDRNVYHHITIVRGHVNCPDCLRMMGS